MKGLGFRDQGFEKMMRVARKLGGFSALTAVLILAGCRQDMHNQPKIYPQRGNELFADGRAARPQIANTVARGQLHENAYFYTGLEGGKPGDGFPIQLTQDVMARGQERYNIYCTPCHSRVGNGEGMIVQRGYRPAGNFHEDRLRNAPLGYFFSVISNGYGAMPDYAAQLTPEDRWAVVAYIRALQLSQNAKAGDAAPGQAAMDLYGLAAKAGMPLGFADPWAKPSTAFYGTANGKDNGIPGQPVPASAGGSSNAVPSQPSPSAIPAAGTPQGSGQANDPGSLAGTQH